MNEIKRTYPFNVYKYAHDIEFIRNRCFNEIMCFERGTAEISKLQYDCLVNLLALLDDLRTNICGCPTIVWLSGKQFALAKECVCWAATQRGLK